MPASMFQKTSSGDVERAIQFICVAEVMIMKREILKFLKEEEGLTMVEYAIAGALIAGVCVVAFQALGLQVEGVITYLTGKIAASGIPAAS